MVGDKGDVAAQAKEAVMTMAAARAQYTAAVDAMLELENERSKLVGPGWNTNKIMGIAQKALPLIVKYGSTVAAGGGIAALFADPGAFKGLLSGITGLFGG